MYECFVNFLLNQEIKGWKVDNDMNTAEKLSELYRFIGFNIDENLATIAITCSGYASENGFISQDAIALVGDHVLKMMITSNEFKKNHKLSKEELTNRYQLKESNKNLEAIGEKNKVKEFLLHSNTDLDGKKKLATSLEAIIGAIFLSEGIIKTEEFLVRLCLIDEKQKNIFDIIDDDFFKKGQSEMVEYGYQSLVFCVIDSVFSIAANYTSTKNVVKRFAEHAGKTIFDEYLISDFVNEFDNPTGRELLKQVLNNRQRTSTRNGILKSEAVIEFIRVLFDNQIETKSDLLKYRNREKILKDIKKIKGQSKGTTFDYLLMLSGDEGVFKRDRHIIKFFSDYFHIKDTSYDNLKKEFEKQLDIVLNKYPKFNIRTLDSVIWKFMSRK